MHRMIGDVEVEAESQERIEDPEVLIDAIHNSEYDLVEISKAPPEKSKGSTITDYYKFKASWPTRHDGLAAKVSELTEAGLALCIDRGNHLDITPRSQKRDAA